MKSTLFSCVKWCWIVLLLYASFLMVELTIPYLQFKAGVEFLRSKQLIYHIDWWRISFYIHVFCSIFTLLPGIFLFLPWLIQKQKKLHRTLGKIYLFTVVFLAAPTGFLMGLLANGGFWSQLSFCLLSVLWFGSSLFAFQKIKQGKIVSHGNWMLISYSLTLSAVTLRLYSFLFDLFEIQLHPVKTYILLSYLSWIPNLVIAWILIRIKFTHKLIGLPSTSPES